MTVASSLARGKKRDDAEDQSPTSGAELLFQIITEREEGACIGLGTNLPFDGVFRSVFRPELAAGRQPGRAR